MGTDEVAIVNRSSGYTGGAGEWVAFLRCWVSAKRRSWRTNSRHPFLVEKWIFDGTTVTEGYATEIASLEERLNLELPRSYKDFLQAYRSEELSVVSETTRGMLSIFQVGLAIEIDPELVNLGGELSWWSSDEKYFVYGEGQNSAEIRTKYLESAVLVGYLGEARYGAILLYPDVRFSDGEMEAAVQFHSGQFRAPSFAELMRQLSYLDESEGRSVPPFPNSAMNKGCARLIPGGAAWWQ